MLDRTIDRTTAHAPRWSRAVLTFVAVLVVASGMPQALAAEDSRGESPGGTYVLADGRVLTVIVWVGLRADGEDRLFAADAPGEVITIRREPDGSIDGLEITTPDGVTLTADKVTLFTEEPVSFSGSGATLSGTMLIPSAPGPHPAVVIVHGAEIGTRDTYRLIAAYFARRGVAALIYDKRGLGESTGRFIDGTFDVLTADALSGLALARSHPDIDSDRVGMVGFSQGGWIIAMAAVDNTDVSFLIPVSASGYTPAEAAAWLSGNLLALRGFDGHAIAMAARGWAMMYSTLGLVDAGVMPRIPDVPGFWFHRLDPYVASTDLWSQVEQPILGLWGELDCQLPARESALAIHGALRAGGNRDHTLRVLAGGSHGLALVSPCFHEMGGMSHHGSRFAYVDGYLDGPAEWILSRETPQTASSLSTPDPATESPLGWHQEPAGDVAWYGTFIPQVGSFVVLLLGFAALVGAWLWRMMFRRRRLEPGVAAWIRNLVGLGAVAGIVAVVLGQGGIAELLTLGDVHADFIMGGPTVDGISPMLTMASTAATASVTFLAAAGVTVAVTRLGAGDRVPAVIGAALPAGVLFLGWIAYWGFLSLRLPTT
jgi:uncharacterized protein